MVAGLAILGTLAASILLIQSARNNNVTIVQRGLEIWGNLTSLLGSADHLHAVMIDAGSTGTRVLVFKFKKSSTDGSLELLDEYFEEVKPGISYYVNEPEKAGQSVEELLEKARSKIPQSDWPKTPAALKATAGLRLLPEEKAQNILNHVKGVFAESGFMSVPDQVSIMDGTYEGLNSWYTLNFLLGRLGGPKENTVASLDLGGGSTQISFVPISEKTLEKAEQSHLSDVTLKDGKTKFYVHSYLGMGLMSARLKILAKSNTTTQHGSHIYETPCFAVGTKETWKFNGDQFTVLGPNKPLQETPVMKKDEVQLKPESFYRCWRFSTLLTFQSIRPVAELLDREVYAMSYYYDRAVESGLIDQKQGGTVKVSDFCDAASRACYEVEPKDGFSCLDLSYICSLLQRGYGLGLEKQITLKKKIDGHETSWALGAAYQMLTGLT